MEEDIIPRFPNAFPDPFFVSEVAVDLENYSFGRINNLDSVQRLIRVLKKHLPEYTNETSPSLFVQFYNPLAKAMRKYSKTAKYIRDTSELALEMKILTSELDAIETSPRERITKTIIPFLSDYSRQLRA